MTDATWSRRAAGWLRRWGIIALSSATLGFQSQQPLTPEEAQALDQAVTEALVADGATDSSIEHISERIRRWSFVLVRAPQGSNDFKLAQTALAKAQEDMKAARARSVEGGKIEEASRQEVSAKLAAARTAMTGRNWVQAEQNIRYVLNRSPNYPVALSLLDEVRRLQRISDLQRLGVFVGLGALGLGGSGAMVLRWSRKSGRGWGRAEPPGIGDGLATLQVVEGVGAGRSARLEPARPVCRIGAATSAKPADANDVVISDAGALVSRFHCTVVRRGGHLFLIDSSTNGTAVNGKWLERGEQVRLGDGDEISIGDVARLTLQYGQ